MFFWNSLAFFDDPMDVGSLYTAQQAYNYLLIRDALKGGWKEAYVSPGMGFGIVLSKKMDGCDVMYRCESWTIKKAECRRIDAFELWCWIRLLRVPWTARKSSSPSWRKSVLNIHWKDWSWSWNSSTLATWCEELTHWKKPWCWERLKARGEGDDRGWDCWITSPIQWIWIWTGPGSW